MVPCSTCAATGKRRYSDSERLSVLGDYMLAGKPLNKALELIDRAEREAVALAAQLLDRMSR